MNLRWYSSHSSLQSCFRDKHSCCKSERSMIEWQVLCLPIGVSLSRFYQHCSFAPDVILLFMFIPCLLLLKARETERLKQSKQSLESQTVPREERGSVINGDAYGSPLLMMSSVKQIQQLQRLSLFLSFSANDSWKTRAVSTLFPDTSFFPSSRTSY